MKIPRLRNGERTTLALQILRAADCDEGYIPTVPSGAGVKALREPRLLDRLVDLGWLEKRERPARNGVMPYKHRYHYVSIDGSLCDEEYTHEHQRMERRYHLTEKGRALLDVATNSPDTLKATMILLTR